MFILTMLERLPVTVLLDKTANSCWLGCSYRRHSRWWWAALLLAFLILLIIILPAALVHSSPSAPEFTFAPVLDGTKGTSIDARVALDQPGFVHYTVVPSSSLSSLRTRCEQRLPHVVFRTRMTKGKYTKLETALTNFATGYCHHHNVTFTILYTDQSCAVIWVSSKMNSGCGEPIVAELDLVEPKSIL